MINYLINKALYGEGDSDQHLLVLFSLVVASRSKNILEFTHSVTTLNERDSRLAKESE